MNLQEKAKTAAFFEGRLYFMEDISVESLKSSFDFGSLVAGLIFGSVGLWLLNHGRKHANNRHVVIALVLMMYPYFVSGALLNWGIGFGICGYLYYTWE